MTKSKQYNLYYFSVFIAAAIFISIGLYSSKDNNKIIINGESLKYELADTADERIKGLSGREKLDDNSAMLFIFPDSGFYGIWMKDMRFSLDIIWLNSKKEVVHIEENVSPDSYPETFLPSKPAKYVIEVNSGFIQSNSISLGDKASF